jgi:hypothetical protein
MSTRSNAIYAHSRWRGCKKIHCDLGKTLVQVDVSTIWNMTLGGRARSEQTSTIISNGSKNETQVLT